MIKEILPGWKGYIVGSAMILYAMVGIPLQWMPQEMGITLILEGLGIIALRMGIKKAEV